MANPSCPIIPQDILDEYGDVLGAKIMRYYENKPTPSVDDVRILADQLINRNEAPNLSAFTEFVTQENFEKQIQKSQEEVADTKFEHPVRGEIYQLKSGKILLDRPSQIAKEVISGKKGKKGIDSLEATPNNKQLAEYGTKLHDKNMYILSYLLDLQSDVIDLQGAEVPQDVDKPDFLSEDAWRNLVASMQIIADDIVNYQKAINLKSRVPGKAKIYMEKFVHDNESVGGTIDLLVSYSNGMFDLYDYKFSRMLYSTSTNEFGEYERVANTDISDIKRRTYRIQTGEYRNVLIKAYGLQPEQFRKISIVPFMMEIGIDPIYNEDGTLRAKEKNKPARLLKTVENIIGINSDNLDILPTGYQLTNNNLLDTIIVELDKRLEQVYEKARKAYYKDAQLKYKQYADEISLLERLIASISANKDVNTVLDYIFQMTTFISNNQNDIPDNELASRYEEVEYFKKILGVVTKLLNNEETNKLVAEELKDNAVITNAMRTNAFKTGIAVQLLEQSQIILRERIELNLEKIQPNIADVTTRSIRENIIAWSEIEEPVIQLAYDVFSKAETKKLQANKELAAKIEVITENAKKEGYTLEQLDRAIFDEYTGDVVERVDFDKRDKLFQAFEEGDVKYIKSVYQYTQKGKQKYKDSLESWKKTLESRYGANSDMYTRNLIKFQEENDLDFSDNAWLNQRVINTYAEQIDKESSYSEEYKNLPKPIKDYLDFYYETMQSFNNLLPEEYLRENMVPNIHAQSTGLLSQIVQSRTPKKIFNLLKHNVKSALQLRQSEIATLTLDLDSRDLKVPLAYKDNFEYYDKKTHQYRSSYTLEENAFYKNKSLMYNLMVFGDAVHHKAFMDETIDLLQQLMYYSREKKSYKLDHLGQIKGVFNKYRRPELVADSGIEKTLSNLLRQHILREYTISRDVIFGKNISMNKFLKAFSNVGRFIALGFNWKVALAGFFTGQSNIIAYAEKETQYNRNQLNASFKDSLFNRANYRLFNEYFDVDNEDHTLRKARQKAKNLINRVLNRDLIYIFYRVEEYGNNVILHSMARNYAIDPSDNKIKPFYKIKNKKGLQSIHDMWVDATDNGQTIENFELTEEQFRDFRVAVRSVARRVKGTAFSSDKSSWSGTALHQVVALYRSWLYPMIENYYGTLRYNNAISEFEVGSQRVLLGELQKGIKDFHLRSLQGLLKLSVQAIPIFGKKLGQNTAFRYTPSKEATADYYEQYLKNHPEYRGKLTEAEYQEIRESAVRQGISNIRAIILIAGILAMLSGDFDEDGERDTRDNPFLNIIYYILKRFQTEILFFYDPKQFNEIIKYPIPLMGIIELLGKWTSNTIDVTTDYLFGQDELSPTGKDIDKTPAGYYTRRIFSPVYQLFNFTETAFEGFDEDTGQTPKRKPKQKVEPKNAK